MAVQSHLENRFDYLLSEDFLRVRQSLERIVSRSSGYRRFMMHPVERVLAILDKWHAPVRMILTFLTFTQLANDLLETSEIPFAEAPDILDGAGKLADLFSTSVRPSDPESIRKAYRARRARDLFYLAYTCPELALISLARHQANMEELQVLDLSQARLVSEESRDIYQPLAELFGLWGLLRDLADKSYRILYSRQISRINEQREIQEKKARPECEAILEKLANSFEQVGLKGDISIHFRSDAGLFRKTEEGVPISEALRKLRFLVVLPEEGDCYRALACIHGLWTPLHGRGKEGIFFKDQISVPKFNGYKDLVTTVEADVPALGFKAQLQFNLVTPEMVAVNQQGYVYSHFLNPQAESAVKAWWNDKELLSFVALRPLNTRSDQIYVFSPVGKVFTNLPVGSICLDYAYRVHSDLGNHCKLVWVNGIPVSVLNELHNGDLVEVEMDRALKAVRPEWLKAVKTSNAQKAIKSALAPAAAARGKNRLFDLYHNELDLYGLKKLIKLDEFERYINKVALEFNYPTLDALYLELGSPKSSLRNQRIDSNTLVENFIFKKLAAQIVRTDELPLGVSDERVRFSRCHHKHCQGRVKPGMPICGRIFKSSNNPRLMVYDRDCPGTPHGDDVFQLEWLGDRRPGELIRMNIQAVDRAELLGNLLDQFYALGPKGLNITGVNAQVDRERKARISLTVEVADYALLNEILQVLSGLRDTGRIDYYQHELVSPLEKRQISQSDLVANPYRTNATGDPRVFKGRDLEINKILDALENGQRAYTIVGLSRIGKSSLLRFLSEQVLPTRGFLPVFLNLQGVSGSTNLVFWTEVFRNILNGLQQKGLPVPGEKKQTKQNHSFSAYDRVVHLIGSAEFQKAGVRLVLLFDEINVLEDAMASQKDAVQVIGELKHLVESDHDGVRCIFATQVVRHSYMSPVGLLNSLLRLGPELKIDHLDQKAAERLIYDPVGNQVEFSSDLVQQLSVLSANHPYYLQNLLYWVMEYVRHEHIRNVDAAALPRIVSEHLFIDSNLFNQYLPEKGSLQRKVLEYLASASLPDRWVSISELRQFFVRDYADFARNALDDAIDLLHTHGALTWRSDHGQIMYKIRVPLFQNWLAANFPVKWAEFPTKR